MSREADLIAALRDRLAKAETPFELSRCHFEAHQLLRDFPGSVEGRLLLERIDRALRAQGAETTPPARPEPPSLWRAAMKPLPWTLGLVVLAYIALRLLRGLLK